MAVTISGSTGIAGVDGSASTPAVQGTDTNTGIAFPAADTVAVATGGTERMRLDASGRLGVGTSTPTQRLEVAGSGMFKTGSDDFVHVFSDSGAIELCRAAGDAYVDLKSSASEDWDVRLQSVGTGGTFTISTNGSERARITSSGSFLVGTTSGDPIGAQTAGIMLQPIGIGDFNANNSESLKVGRFGGTGALVQLFYHNGSTLSVVGSISTNGSSTSYNTTSDYRLKESVVPLTGAAARVQALKPSRFNFIADPDRTVDGFIAHEAAEVVPEAVVGEKDAVNEDGSIKPQGIDQSKLVPLLTAALQEALTEIAALKARVAALETN